MAANQYWLSYDARDDRPRPPRRWPWLLLLLLLLLAALLIAGWLWYDDSEGIDFTQPIAIQAALPALLTDDAMIVYVVDDSGSLNPYLGDLRQAVRDVSQAKIENSKVAMLLHGDYPTTVLFEFTEPENIPWESTIQSVTAQSATEWMYQALDEARQMLQDEPDCYQQSVFVFFERTQCFLKTIVLIGDGNTFDPEMSEIVIEKLERSKITVHSVYLGSGNQFAMQTVATRTAGEFVSVR